MSTGLIVIVVRLQVEITLQHREIDLSYSHNITYNAYFETTRFYVVNSPEGMRSISSRKLTFTQLQLDLIEVKGTTR
jgi:hypothetical protein